MASRRRIRRQQSDQHHRRSDKRVQRQLHRRILAPRRSPDRDQEILRHDRNLVKHKQQEQIEAEKHAVHAADQRQKEREELIRPQFDVPAEQHACHRGQSRQQHQHAADAVRRQRVANAHRRHPRHIDQRHASLPSAAAEPGNRNRKSRHRHRKRKPSRQRCLTLRQQRQHQRTGKRDVNRPSQHRSQNLQCASRFSTVGFTCPTINCGTRPSKNINPITGAIASRSPPCRSGNSAQCSGTGPVNTF